MGTFPKLAGVSLLLLNELLPPTYPRSWLCQSKLASVCEEPSHHSLVLCRPICRLSRSWTCSLSSSTSPLAVSVTLCISNSLFYLCQTAFPGSIWIQISHSFWVLYALHSRHQQKLTVTFQLPFQTRIREKLASPALSRCPHLVSASARQKVYRNVSWSMKPQTDIGDSKESSTL